MDSLRNIEIKARISKNTDFKDRIQIAKELTSTEGELIKQHDVFFKTTTNRLKLRYLEVANSMKGWNIILIFLQYYFQQPKKSVLINYSRPNVEGPKLSEYDLLEVDNPKLLEKMLSDTVGKLGEVNKTRHLFLYEHTRIHLDEVESLGTFIEFEVVLEPKQTIEEGTVIAEKLMRIFKISQEDLLEGAYMDQLLK